MFMFIVCVMLLTSLLTRLRGQVRNGVKIGCYTYPVQSLAIRALGYMVRVQNWDENADYVMTLEYVFDELCF